MKYGLSDVRRIMLEVRAGLEGRPEGPKRAKALETVAALETVLSRVLDQVEDSKTVLRLAEGIRRFYGEPADEPWA